MKQLQRSRETAYFLQNNDVNLGFRRLLDCVTDTQNMQLYAEAIALAEWKEVNPDASAELIKRGMDLLLKTEQISIEPCDISLPTVSANGIQKQYKPGGFALGPITMEVTKGQVYGLVGENGNGKTTLLRILARELSESNGSLRYSFTRGVQDDYDLRTRLVYIPQRTQKWYGSLKDNLKLVLSSYRIPAHENETRVLLMIARLGLLPYKNFRWKELSSGYKMRFELARTLLRKPEVLLLDEPLANLDVVAQQIILEDLKSIANSVNHPIGLMLSSQQLYEVEKVSDKIIYLKNGRYTDHDFTNNNNYSTEQLIVEIESTAGKEELVMALKSVVLEKITYNGGVYIAYFNNETTFAQILSILGSSGVALTYIRNITHSTRKYFIA